MLSGTVESRQTGAGSVTLSLSLSVCVCVCVCVCVSLCRLLSGFALGVAVVVHRCVHLYSRCGL